MDPRKILGQKANGVHFYIEIGASDPENIPDCVNASLANRVTATSPSMFSKRIFKAGETAQWLRALAALWLLFQKTRVQFLAPTRQTTTFCHSSFRGSHTLFWPLKASGTVHRLHLQAKDSSH